MPREPRTWQWAVPVALGLILVLLSARLFATVPVRQAEQRAYTTASACPAGTADTRADDCTTRVPAAVERKEHRATPKGGGKNWLHLVERGANDGRRVRMDDVGGPVYESVAPGDRVTVTYWRGEIRSVQAGDLSEATRATPVDGWRTPLGAALALLPVALMLLHTGWFYRYRYDPAVLRHRYMWGVSTAFLAAVLLGAWAFLASGIGDGVPGVLLAAAVGAPPCAALGFFTWTVWRRLLKANDTSDIVPRVPAGRRVLSADVRGNVPYSVDGHGCLVVGDGRPATSPDPTGRYALEEVPETLTVQGVRGFRLGEDPDGWFQKYRYTGVAMECRDGDETVLIATKRRDAPVVLGALLDTLTCYPS